MGARLAGPRGIAGRCPGDSGTAGKRGPVGGVQVAAHSLSLLLDAAEQPSASFQACLLLLPASTSSAQLLLPCQAAAFRPQLALGAFQSIIVFKRGDRQEDQILQ